MNKALNKELLEKLMLAVDKKFPDFFQRILKASADYGTFGLDLLDALHERLPRTACDNCGTCCNSVSIFSLEYHRIIRDLMVRLAPDRLRTLFLHALRFDQRLAAVGSEDRLRCVFRDEQTRVCLIHPVRPFACRIFGLLKEDGTRECEHVRDLHGNRVVAAAEIERLQTKVFEVSESFAVVPEDPGTAFFPFEFWLYRYSLGPERALEIYRDILVPASTPLTRLWQQGCP